MADTEHQCLLTCVILPPVNRVQLDTALLLLLMALSPRGCRDIFAVLPFKHLQQGWNHPSPDGAAWSRWHSQASSAGRGPSLEGLGAESFHGIPASCMQAFSAPHMQQLRQRSSCFQAQRRHDNRVQDASLQETLSEQQRIAAHASWKWQLELHPPAIVVVTIGGPDSNHSALHHCGLHPTADCQKHQEPPVECGSRHNTCVLQPCQCKGSPSRGVGRSRQVHVCPASATSLLPHYRTSSNHGQHSQWQL